MSNIHGIGVDQVNLNRIRKILDKSKSKFEVKSNAGKLLDVAPFLNL